MSRKKRAAALAAAAPAPRSAPGPAPKPNRWRLAAHLAAAALLLVLVEWHRAAIVRSEPGGRFEDLDAQFHAWRVTRAVAAKAILPLAADPFDSFPSGGRALWPPLHDTALALMARLGGSTPADPRAGMPFAGVFPVIESVAALLLAAAAARRAAGERAAIFTAWALALTPALARRAAYGELDHNVTEVVCTLAFAALAVLHARGRPRPFAFALAWGALLLLALGAFTGSLAAAGLFGLALLAVDRERAGEAAAGFALAALAIPLFAALRVPADPADPWRFGPSFALGAAAGAMALGGGALLLERRLDSLSRRLAAAGFLAGALVWAFTPAVSRAAFFRATSFLGARDPWLATIDEFQPLLSGAHFAPLATLAHACPPLVLLGAALLLAPRELARQRLLALPALAFLVLALGQRRFLPPAIVLAALAASVVLAPLAGARRFAAPAALAIGTLVALPYLRGFLSQTLSGEARLARHPAESAAALLGATPDPGDPPAWSVLAPWDWGHPLLFASHRPMAVNNFGSMQPGFERKLRILLDPSPAHALAELKALKVRYVVTAFPRIVVPDTAAIVGEDPESYFDGVDRETFDASGPVRRPGQLALLVRLHEGLPAEREADREALAHFREVGETRELAPGTWGPAPAIKVFEVVP